MDFILYMIESRQVVHLTNLSLNDTGFYSCTVRNQYGGAVSTGWVQVIIVHFKPTYLNRFKNFSDDLSKN